jgi:hypothetical protein
MPPRSTGLAAVILIGLGLVLVVNLPGHLSYDSVVQLWEGRRGVYLNWHPPVMSWMLGVADWVVPGTGLFVTLDAVLLYGSLLALMPLRPRPSWVATSVACLCIATPQFLLYPGIVWKDVLFAGASVASFVLMAHAAANWDHREWRLGVLAATAVLVALAALTRQNGIVMVPVAAIAGALIAMSRTASRRAVWGLAYGAALLFGVLVVVAGARVALATRIVGPSGPASQFRLLQTYDIAGALAHEPGLALTRIHDDDPVLEHALRTDAARLYTPERNDTLASSASLQAALQNADDATIPAQWHELVTEHPWLYLRTRADAFRWLVLPPNAMASHPYYVGVSGPLGEMSELGLSRRLDGRDHALKTYAELFVGTPVFSHMTYALLALAELYLLARRRLPTDIAIGGMLVGSLAFAATFFVISIACDYRYLYVLDVSAMVAGLYIALDGAEAFRPGLDPRVIAERSNKADVS